MNPTQLISRLESLSPEEKTPELTELEKELRDHGKYFNDLMTQIATTGVLTEEVKREKEERSNIVRKVGERILFLLGLETLLEKELNLREQYMTQMELLRKREGLLRIKDEKDPEGRNFKNIPGTVGIVEMLSDGREGYVAIDNKEYSAPTYEMIQQKFRERCESDPVFFRKFDQQYGGGTMLLVPKGAKLTHFVEQYESTLLERAQGKGLFLTDDTLETPGDQIEQCPSSDMYRGIYVNEEYCEGGKDDNESGGTIDDAQLLYAPTYVYGNITGGKTKEDYLKEGTFPGWDILFLEKDIHIPAYEVITQEGRTRLIANESPLTYMKKLQKDPQYAGEKGMTPEEWLIFANAIASSYGQVIDDWCGNGSINCLIGSVLVSGSVPDGDWSRVYARANLDCVSPDLQRNNRGFRPALKM